MVSHIALVDGRTVKNPVPRRRRYKKKVEKDEDYIRQVKSLGDAVESSIMQNYAKSYNKLVLNKANMVVPNHANYANMS